MHAKKIVIKSNCLEFLQDVICGEVVG